MRFLAQDEVRGTIVIVVRKEQAYAVLEYLKTDPELAYTFLVDVTAVLIIRRWNPN